MNEKSERGNVDKLESIAEFLISKNLSLYHSNSFSFVRSLSLPSDFYTRPHLAIAQIDSKEQSLGEWLMASGRM